MDDVPQGGAGGVPGHHPDQHSDHHGHAGSGPARPDDHRDSPTPTVKTVRAGTPVAEQAPRPEGEADEETDTPAGA
ncbi:hypothetical protein [Kitasatospora camelliae]|uniref:Uncharacterized protein n=1 Tax=Kitasatospora camelliae TaxID=3156397 RepID=A0AAU8JQT4_9ACTN